MHRQRLRFLLEGGKIRSLHHNAKETVRTVDCDTEQVAHLLDLAAGQANRPEIPQNKVVIGTTSLEFVAVLDKDGCECLRVGDNLFCICLE
jgi:hypothetical protein